MATSKKPSAVLDYYVAQAVIQGSAGSMYKITYDSEAKEPHFDGVKITLPVLGVECTKEDIDQQRAFINRCVAYGRWGEGNRTPILKDKNPNDRLTQLFHQSDDARCEKLEAHDFLGVHENLTLAEEQALKSLFKQLSTLDDSVFNDDRASKELAALAAKTLANATWNRSSRDYLQQMVKLYSGSKVGDYIGAMFERGITAKFLEAETAEESYEVAHDLYKLLFEDSEGEGEGTGDHDKPQSGEGSGEGEGAREGSEYGEGMSEEMKAAMRRIMTEYTNQDREEGGTPNPVIFTYEGRGDHESEPVESFADIRVVDFKTDRWSRHGGHGGVESLAPGGLDIERASAAFANQVRRLLQIKAQAYYTHGHRKGELSTKRLYRIAMPTIGDGSWNQRVFKKRHQDRILDVAVSIMIDVSGSMHCAKHAWTYKGCVLLNEVFSKVLHVPVEIACFNTDDRTRIGLIKGYQAPISQGRIKEIFDDITGSMTGNNDATALLWAASRLVRRKEARKILIMMSDGQPASGSHHDADYQLRHAARSVEARRDMELHSIGIEYNGVSKFYSNWSEVKTGKDIEEALLKVLSTALLQV